jgi:hypothetical protein
MPIPIIIALGALYSIAAIYCALPSLHDAHTCLTKGHGGEALMFVFAAVVMAILSPLAMLYRFILYLPSLIERLPAP